MKKTVLIALLAFAILITPIYAQENFDTAFDDLESAFDDVAQGQEEVWEQTGNTVDSEWNAVEKQTEAEWERLRQEVEQKWDEFYYSTNKEWVEYDTDKSTRSRVNFEKGEIEIVTLVPVEEVEGTEAGTNKPAKKEFTKLPPKQVGKIKFEAEKKIEKRIKKIFSNKNEVKEEVLAKQVMDPEGHTVTSRNISSYIKKHLMTKVTVGKKPIIGKDKKPRIRVAVIIKMVPRHLEIRASKYKSQVKKYATKYKLEPALLFAVIHTESYFNPLAKSWVPAYGLMQLVPKYGAIEAYSYLYGKNKLLSAKYLYNPENNVMLGATYFHLLDGRYFAKVKNIRNRQSLCIAAYNCGPTRVTKKILRKYDVDKMSNEELVKVIRKVLPKETKDYILRVQKRITLYEGMS